MENATANHLNFPHFDNSAFCNIFAKSNRFDAFLRSPFARMAELVDALDSKSNVLKKTCRFEPGFGHKKMRVKTLIFLCPDGTFCLIGEWFPKPPFCRFAPRPALLHPHFFVPGGSSPKVVIRTGLTQLLLGISPFIRRQSAEENPPE